MIALAEIAGSRTTWLGLALIFGYWPIAWLVPAEQQLGVENAIRFSVGLTVMIGYTPGLVEALRAKHPTYGHQLVLGIVLSWMGGTGTSGWTLLWRFGGKPLWMLQSNLAGWFLWLIILGGLLHDTAKYREVRGERLRDWRYVIAAGYLALVLGLIIVLGEPDLRFVTTALRPLFGDGY